MKRLTRNLMIYGLAISALGIILQLCAWALPNERSFTAMIGGASCFTAVGLSTIMTSLVVEKTRGSV